MSVTSLWEAESFYATQDVIIAGAGLMGLWTAYELKQINASLNIMILERGAIPTGASTRNAGFACFGSPGEILTDLQNCHEDDVWKLVDMRYRGIHKIRKVLGDAAIDYEASGGYECFTSLDKQAAVEANLPAINTALQAITGNPQTYTWCHAKLAAFGMKGFTGMIENKLEGGLHSGKLVMALTNMVRRLGVQIINNTTVTDWQTLHDTVQVATSANTFTCRHLLFACNAFTNEVAHANVVVPARGQILVTNPIEGLPLKGTFHYDEGYYYFRNVGNRILLGGARNADFAIETTTILETTSTIQNALENFLATHLLPATPYTITHRWSGIMGFTQNKKPNIQMHAPHVWSAIACNGMGVAISPIVAAEIAGKITQGI